MRAGMKALWIAALAIGVMAALTARALGSGYHPGFDQAVAEAKVIVVGQVTEAWLPKSRTSGQSEWYAKGEVYRMRVTDVYKGNVRAGDDVVFWDPHSTSTAGYFVTEGKPNLTFLVEGSPDAEQLRMYDYGAELTYAPISNFTGGVEDSEQYDGWVYLLNMVLRGSPVNDITTYRTILPTQSNRYVLNYMIEHWPREMSKEDEDLFRAALKRHRDDPYITSPILDRLAEAGKGFTTEELVNLLKTSDELSREDLLRYVNSGNVAACQEIIFGWISQDWAWDESTKVLARLAPDYLKGQLRKRDLPFWVLIPCLQELHINGRAVGRRDFATSVLNSNPYTLRMIGEVITGDSFSAVLAMENPTGNSDWRTAFPLLDKLLAGPDCQARRLMVAVMRTFGENVKRAGKGYIRISGGAKPRSPVRIELVAPKGPLKVGKPIRMTVKEIGQVSGAWISFKGEIAQSVEGRQGAISSGGGFGLWADTRAPRRDFIKLRKGLVHTSTNDIGSFIERPGVYQVRMQKIYPHDGGSVGLDAWTGVVFSKPVQVTVTR